MLTEAMKEYPFPTPDGSCEDLQVFLHCLPDEQGRRTYPFICVRWVSGDINEGVDGYIGAEGRDTLALVLEYHMATVFPEYQYIIPSTPLGGTLKEHTYE